MRHLANTSHLSKEAYLRKTPKNGKSRAETVQPPLEFIAPQRVEPPETVDLHLEKGELLSQFVPLLVVDAGHSGENPVGLRSQRPHPSAEHRGFDRLAKGTDPAPFRPDLLERLIEITSGRVVRRFFGRGPGGRVRRPVQLRPVRPDRREQPARVEAM